MYYEDATYANKLLMRCKNGTNRQLEKITAVVFYRNDICIVERQDSKINTKAKLTKNN